MKSDMMVENGMVLGGEYNDPYQYFKDQYEYDDEEEEEET